MLYLDILLRHLALEPLPHGEQRRVYRVIQLRLLGKPVLTVPLLRQVRFVVVGAVAAAVVFGCRRRFMSWQACAKETPLPACCNS